MASIYGNFRNCNEKQAFQVKVLYSSHTVLYNLSKSDYTVHVELNIIAAVVVFCLYGIVSDASEQPCDNFQEHNFQHD